MSARPALSLPSKPLKFLGWFLIGLTVVCLLAAHAGVGFAARLAAILATLALTVALAGRATGPYRVPRVVLTLLAGAALVVAVYLGHLQSLPQLLPPVLIPMLLGWTFGRTLLAGRTPLIERVARAVHDVPDLGARMSRYTRRVTALWTALFGALVLVNGFLLCNAQPGGLFDLAGRAAPWPVSLAACAALGGATGLVILGVFVGEFLVRVTRFPNYRFRNPVEFARGVRARWPAIVASLRDE